VIPGTDLGPRCNDFDNNSFGRCTGTSMSTPMIASAAALITALDVDITPDQIQQILIDSANIAS